VKYYSGKTYPEVKMQCIAKLWDVTTLVLARELHRLPMDQNRTNVMANIFVKFAMTYISSHACPSMESWKEAVKAHKLEKLHKRNQSVENVGEEFDPGPYRYKTAISAPGANPKPSGPSEEHNTQLEDNLLETNNYSHYSDVAERDWS
jgi:hypothetical protein